MKRFLHALFLCAAIGAAPAGQAQTAQAPGAVPPVETMVTALTPASAGPIVRSMSQSGNLPFQANQYIPDGFDFPAYSFQIEFSEDGHLLTSDGMTALRGLAAALSDPRLQSATVQVGVHVANNNGLGAMPVSSRRAQAVVEHLVTFYGLPAERLVPFGYGNSKLLDQANPANPANERVELINVTALN